MQPHFLHSNLFLFDLGLRQSIHTCSLFSRRLLASIFNKSCLIQNLLVVIFIHYKMVNLDSITNKNNKKWLYIPDHPYRILMIGGWKSGKKYALINLINEQNDIDKINLYAKDLSEHEILIKRSKNAGIKYFNDPNTFIECSNTMDDVYENIDDYNPSRKRKIVLDDMMVGIMTSKKFRAKIEELFERCRKLNISLVFIAQSCFAFLKDVRLNFV